MGASKTEIFSEKQNRLAQLFKALAHPARVAIVQELLRTKACICGELVNDLGLAQATISQHLKELKAAGLIQGEVEGTKVCYCINAKVWKQFEREVNQILGAYQESNTCC